MSTNWCANWIGPSSGSIVDNSLLYIVLVRKYNIQLKMYNKVLFYFWIKLIKPTQALLNCRSPMIRVESNTSFPGPKPIHSWAFPLQVDVRKSHGNPVSMPKNTMNLFQFHSESLLFVILIDLHLAPWIFGETSPRFEAPKAAINDPFPGITLGPFISSSKSNSA